MADPLATGTGAIGGGGITYTYTDFELTAAVGDGFIDAPDINISLTAQTAILRTGGGTIGAGLPTLGFDDYSAELVAGYGTIGTGVTQLREIVRALFPSLAPSDRSFTPPEYALSRYKTTNGAKSRRLWASQPGGGSLDLTFENINDADAESILAAHDLAKGATNDVILPDRVLSGVEGDLLAYMRSPGGQAWSFAEAPEVEFVNEGVSTVRVKLSARRKIKFNSVGGTGAPFAVGAAPVDEIDPTPFGSCDLFGSAPGEGSGAFDPMEYAFWRAIDAATSAPLTLWNSTATSRATYDGSSVLCPGGSIPWFGGADINVVPPTSSAGGSLGSVNITNLSGGIFAGIRGWFGSVSTGVPFVVSDPIAFEFSNNAASVVASWGGVTNPC